MYEMTEERCVSVSDPISRTFEMSMCVWVYHSTATRQPTVSSQMASVYELLIKNEMQAPPVV